MARQAGRCRRRGTGPRRRDDRKGERRDPVAGRRQGARDRRQAGRQHRGGQRAHPARGRRRGQRRGPRGGKAAGAGASRARSRRRHARRPATPACRQETSPTSRSLRRRRRSTPSPAPHAKATSATRTGRAPDRVTSVRRRAWELGIDLHVVQGSGPGGRVMHDDLDAHVAAGGQVPSFAASEHAARAQRRDGRAGHRPAPQDRAEDAGIEAAHSALHVCRGGRRHRARSAARAAQRDVGVPRADD